MRVKATIRERKTGWFLDTMVEGRRYKKKLGPGTRKWAQRQGDEVLAELLADENSTVAASNVSFKKFGDMWEGYADSGFGTRGKLTNKSKRACKSSFALVWRHAGYDEAARLVRLTTKDVRAWHRDWIDTKLKAAELDELELDEERLNASAHSTWSQAKSLFGRRAVNYYEETHGVKGLRAWVQEMNRIDLPRGSIPIYQLPPAELIKRTEDNGNKLKETDPVLWIIYKLAINTGLRARELAFFSPDWVEDHRGQTCIAVVNRPSFKPKGRPRRVPIDPKLWAEILRESQQVWKYKFKKGQAEFVLPAQSAFLREELVNRCFSPWMREQGWDAITYKKASHELRKLFGSRVYTELGPAYAQEYLGHISVDTTCRYYAALDKPLVALPVR